MPLPRPLRIPWTRAERRWRDALCAAVAPPLANGTLPDISGRMGEGFWSEVEAAAPPLLRLGLRGAVVGLALSPPLLVGRLTTFDRLTPDEQERVVTRVAGSRWFIARQLPLTLKLMVCFAYLRDPEVRAAVERQGS